jgi:PB1 domain
MPKNLPPTPPSESESYSLQRSRSRSQPAIMRSTARSSGESSDYNPAPRTRLDTVRDEDDRGSTEMRRAKSVGARGRAGDERRRGEERLMNRSMSTRRPEPSRRKDDGDDIYDLYNDYYDEKPVMRSRSTRRPLVRTLTRTRTSSSSRGRSRDDEDDYSNRYSDDEDDEFEMVTPKRSEISKIKVKVTMKDTARIVMIPVDIEIREFTERVAAKFNVAIRKLKCTFLDEDGQELDLCDQDELEMLIELAKEDAKLNRREFGRAEVTFAPNFPFRA